VKVCLDTNVLVAAFATRGLCADVLRTVLVDHEHVIGDVIFAELERVLTGKLGVPELRLDAVRAALATATVVPRPATPHPLPLVDSDHGWIVATAIDGQADVLVTGDGGLLEAGEAAPLAVLSPRAFWERLRAGR
jgi:uncharacterized protein